VNTFTFNATDGSHVFARAWLPEPDQKTLAAVQIAHGMAEHSLRYTWFAEKLTAEGFAVYANDHRGHGETARTEERLGHFGDVNGWNQVVEDMKSLNRKITETHENLPVFLFGHSMGSFLSRDYIAEHGSGLKGAILSGTTGDPGILGRIGLMIAKAQAKLSGGKKPSSLMDKLSFGAYSKAFSPVMTPFDWLSRDSDQVDAYIKDPYCGFICSAQFYTDLISGIIKINSMAHIERTPKNLPVYLFAGRMDPVGNFGKGVEETHDAFKKTGIRDLHIKLYEQGRHEMLNEINRDEVAADVITWIKDRL